MAPKVNAMTRAQVLDAVRAIPPEEYFVWDGVDEDDRPATQEELDAALETYRAKRGRAAGSGTPPLQTGGAADKD